VARAHADGPQRERQGVGAIRHGHGLGGPGELGELPLEGLNLGAPDVVPGTQHAGGRLEDLVLEGLPLDSYVGKRDFHSILRRRRAWLPATTARGGTSRVIANAMAIPFALSLRNRVILYFPFLYLPAVARSAQRFRKPVPMYGCAPERSGSLSDLLL